MCGVLLPLTWSMNGFGVLVKSEFFYMVVNFHNCVSRLHQII